MSGTTLEQAQAQLAALLAAKAGNVLTVRYGDRFVTFREAAEILAQITYWERRIGEIQRVNAGTTRHGISVADFTRSNQ